MEEHQTPLRDVFATQGIIAVLIGILICVLHIAAPEICRNLLHAWHETEANSPALADWFADLTAWVQAWFA